MHHNYNTIITINFMLKSASNLACSFLFFTPWHALFQIFPRSFFCFLSCPICPHGPSCQSKQDLVAFKIMSYFYLIIINHQFQSPPHHHDYLWVLYIIAEHISNLKKRKNLPMNFAIGKSS